MLEAASVQTMSDYRNLWSRPPGILHCLLTALLVAAGLISATGPSRGVTTAYAAGPAPRLFALSASVFPTHTRLTGGPLSDVGAQAPLHAAALNLLGRLSGYGQTATWTARGNRKWPLTLHYHSSIFSTSDGAASAYDDARASLWEAGIPIRVPGLARPGFIMTERGARTEVGFVSYRGRIEFELLIRYPSSIDARSKKDALERLGHAGAAAARLISQRAPGDASPIGVGALPTIAEAPWGTGPVVKSPSLMVMGATGVVASAQIAPGLFRPGPSVLFARVSNAASLLPVGGYPAFSRIGVTSGGGEIYDSAVLFKDPESATQSFEHMAAMNRGRRWLKPFDLQPYASTMKRLAGADGALAWQGSGEMIVLLRYQNVVMGLASTGRSPADLLLLADQLGGAVPTSIHADGTKIVDRAGFSVHLAGLNWYGAEQQDFAPGGLDIRSYRDILTSIKSLGYNSIRLPFSNQLVEQNPIVTAHVGANPDLQGLHGMDILDRIVSYAGALGLSVILDDHRSDAGWSSQENGLWYTPQYPDSSFVRDWGTVAHRYAVNNVVVGADLRNEPHGVATWGDGNLGTDWRAAAQRSGNAVLAQNPNLLIMVEGVQFYGKVDSYWWGGNLMGVATAPVALSFADGSSAQSRLVYSPHDYGKDNCGGGCPWLNPTTSYVSLSQLWDQYWGYIAADATKLYAAPIWVGEFGTCNYQKDCVANADPGTQGQWFSGLLRYLQDHHLSWCYWSANGTQSSAPARTYGELDWYGVFGRNWLVAGPWVQDALRGAQADAPTGDQIAPH